MIRTTLVGLLAGAATLAAAANAPADLGVSFSLRPVKEVGKVQLTLARDDGGRRRSMNSQPRPWAELQGLEPAALTADGKTPARFQLARDAGAFDCEGVVGRSVGAGECRFAPSARFAETLAQRGVGRPSAEQQFHLAMNDARLAALDAIQAAGFPTPSLAQFTAAAVHDVDETYVGELARAGYKLERIDDLIAFRIHDVDAAYVRGLAEASPRLRGVPAPQILALRIHDVTPQYVRGMEAAGFRDLSAERLVAMSIHDVTPEYVREMRALGLKDVGADKLVAMRIHDVDPAYVRAMGEAGYRDLDADQLIALRIHDVDPDYARRMAALGLEAERLVDARVHGRRR